jgi:hypothetical protein
MKFILSLITISSLYSSGGYDNGTATGKGLFKLDFTLNPFNKYSYGQSYLVGSYGVTNSFDIHGYFSDHNGDYKTWYVGIFYQFFNSKRLDLASAIGVRNKLNSDMHHLFAPQILYTVFLSKRFFVGGSLVNIKDLDSGENYGNAIDLSLHYELAYKSKIINNVSVGVGVFHPATWEPKQYFLPTYSIDITFN